MPITKLIERQSPLVAMANLTIKNMGAANAVTMNIPANALVTRVLLQTVVAFDSVTTSTGTVTDGTTSFVTAQDTKTVGAETSVGAPKFYPTGGTITASLAETGATATVGQAIALVEYVVVGRGGEVQG